MRLCWQAFAVASIFFSTPSVAGPSYGSRLLEHVRNFRETFTPPLIPVSDETRRREPDTTVFASMSGKCRTLKIAGRDFACRVVAFYQTEQGRANFTIVLDDPADNAHIVTFSGENGRKDQDDLYELSVDRMLLRSKDRPKVDGLPAPLVELSTGTCKQLGNFAKGQVSSIANRWLANSSDEGQGNPGANGKAPRQADRAIRMPSQGRCGEDPAQRPDRLHHWMLGRR